MPSASTVKRPPSDVIKGLYIQWLKGASLRKIAHGYGQNVSYSAIHSWFQKEYGPLATNEVAMSLARSLLEDYEGSLEEDSLLDWILGLISTGQLEKAKHRSKHSLNQLSKFQVVHELKLLDFIAVDDSDPLLAYLVDRWDFLRLPYAIAVFNHTGDVLKHMLTCEANLS